MKNKNWNSEDLKILIELKGKLDYKEIAKILNRSESAVLHKLSRLKDIKKGIPSKYNQVSTLRNIIDKYRKGVELRKKLREIYKEYNITDLDKIPDNIYCGGSKKIGE